MVDDISIRFEFFKGGEFEVFIESFDPADCCLQATINDRRDELHEEDSWEFVDSEIHSFDTNYADPADFDGLDDYGEYCELVGEFGEAYKLRYDDLGGCSRYQFQNEYCGCWSDFQEYAEQLIEDCYGIPNHLASYIDYEKWARDIHYDYSEYAGSEGTHVFRD